VIELQVACVYDVLTHVDFRRSSKMHTFV